MPFDVQRARDQFPALASGSVFLDNPGGTQVPTAVIDAVSTYLRDHNANLGGHFRTSLASDDVMSRARAAAADLLGGSDSNEIVFGQNMTTLTFQLSRALAPSFGPGDEILVTRLDHDANIAPWTAMARDRGATVRALPFDPSDCTLRLDLLSDHLTERTKLVAVGLASNAVGTVNPVKEICERARAVGALTFVDAVQYAPHGVIDVQALGCDFLACSAYKFFGPHIGLLWGRYQLLDRINAYRVRPAKNSPPHKFETGTLNHEGIAGTLAAIDYLASLAPEPPRGHDGTGTASPRRARLERALHAIETYERKLCAQLLDVLESIDGVRVYGLIDRERLSERVPTVAITVSGHTPAEVAQELSEQDIFVWDGDYYAVDVIDDLGLRAKGGMVRIGLAHYNTSAEIDRLGVALKAIAS